MTIIFKGRFLSGRTNLGGAAYQANIAFEALNLEAGVYEVTFVTMLHCTQNEDACNSAIDYVHVNVDFAESTIEDQNHRFLRSDHLQFKWMSRSFRFTLLQATQAQVTIMNKEQATQTL